MRSVVAAPPPAATSSTPSTSRACPPGRCGCRTGSVSSAFLLAWWWSLRDRDETPDPSLPEGLQGEDAVADDVLAPVGQPTG